MFISDVINWYIKYFGNLLNYDNGLRTTFFGASTSLDKAKIVLLGDPNGTFFSFIRM